MRHILLPLVFGCTASSDAVLPPTDQLFDPTGLAISPDERVLFVTNANAELRYNGGTVLAVDLDVVDATIAAWLDGAEIPAGCAQDGDHTETLVCPPAAFLRATAARIGNFAANLAVQDRGDGHARIVIPVRGDPSITWIDWDGETLACGDDVLCDDAHRLVIDNDRAVEPFDVTVDSGGHYAVVTHFTSGAITLVDSPPDGAASISDVLTGVFRPDGTGNEGASAIATRIAPGEPGIVYAGSRFEDRIQTFTVARPLNGAPPFLLRGAWFFLDTVRDRDPDEPTRSTDTRGLAFAADGSELYVLNRRPPSVEVYDTSRGASDAPRNAPIAATDVCRVAERLTVVGDHIYVTCFQDGELYVIDRRGSAYVEDVLEVGAGPYGLAASASRERVYVTSYLEDSLAVIDASASPTHHRVVLKLR